VRRSEWLVSGFIVWHAFAIALTALPDRVWVDRPKPTPEEAASSPVVPEPIATITRAADTVLRPVSAVVWQVRRVSRAVLGRPVAWYIQITGHAQNWAMFANPPTYDRYWRVRYYVQPAAGRPWSATELVLPAHREDRIRVFQGYFDSYTDKAFEIAYTDFMRRRKPNTLRPDSKPSDLPDDLKPILRFFTRRFAARLRPGAERVVRSELWYGVAANRPPFAPVQPLAQLERQATLLTYAEGPIEDRLRVRQYAPYRGREEEADIGWVLECYEEP
jgi:hypothetical protein